MANFIGGFLTGVSSLYLATHPEAVSSFMGSARSGAEARCKYCGRDPTIQCHDHGYNGFFNDKNMACKGKQDSLYRSRKEQKAQARSEMIQREIEAFHAKQSKSSGSK